MDALAWAAFFLVLGLALASLEVFVPSGGIIGFLSITSVVTGIIFAFNEGPGYGVGFLGMAVVGLPLVLAAALKWWPNTPMGRRFLLSVPNSDDVLPDNDQRRTLKELVGQIGEAKCLMLPGGVVNIGGQNVDAVSEGMAIEKGQWVRVVEVRGTRVVVRPTDQEGPSTSPDDTLSRPIESIGLNPFEDPLA